ncbi:hypothetical protein RFI_38766 [Reticulomyxa filosa]|uniref:Uncharacterized protein n=1 Tax=Reticulomyxa filosa TaxID=46433 RepID=X6LD98_RETFI|nr:hypothetical protein RFI_38766 [Reticulomyxa filosa]|eukprot:ETN98724.1 hypothetical protein RFI_38766 [Reticulomyxa filosa]
MLYIKDNNTQNECNNISLDIKTCKYINSIQLITFYNIYQKVKLKMKVNNNIRPHQKKGKVKFSERKEIFEDFIKFLEQKDKHYICYIITTLDSKKQFLTEYSIDYLFVSKYFDKCLYNEHEKYEHNLKKFTSDLGNIWKND